MRRMSLVRAAAAALPALREMRGPMRPCLAVVSSMRGVLRQVRRESELRGRPCRGGAIWDA